MQLKNDLIKLKRWRKRDEYSCAVTPQVRQTGNRLSGLAGTRLFLTVSNIIQERSDKRFIISVPTCKL